MILRPEIPADVFAIRHVTDMAFAGAEHRSGTEGAIVDALRKAGALALSLVVEDGGEVVGHVAFSPVSVEGRDVGWFGLGPVSVRPDRQGEGIGSELVREGIGRLRSQDARGCVVLGDPAFYRRFGFECDPALRLEGVQPDCFMALTLNGQTPVGSVTYDPAFEAA